MLINKVHRLVVIQHIAREGPGLFLDIARENNMNIKLVRIYLGESIPIPNQHDIFLSLGGPMGLSDIDNPNYKWLKAELDLLKRLLLFNIPYIGVCLGAQLLAFAAGGNVTPLLDTITAKPKAEIGWYPIRILDPMIENNFLLNGDSSVYSLHWHADRILLPSTAELIASSVRCEEQMFKIGKYAYGLQFHMEIEFHDVDRWIKEDVEFIKTNLGDKGSDQLYRQTSLYCLKTRRSRLEFIRRLFALIIYN